MTDSVCDIVTRAESGASKSRPRSTNTLAVLVFVGLVATVSCRVCMQHTAARVHLICERGVERRRCVPCAPNAASGEFEVKASKAFPYAFGVSPCTIGRKTKRLS